MFLPATENKTEDNTGQHTNFCQKYFNGFRYITGADSENGLIFAELVLVFEIIAFFMKILFA